MVLAKIKQMAMVLAKNKKLDNGYFTKSVNVNGSI